jgi:hypothetical protein
MTKEHYSPATQVVSAAIEGEYLLWEPLRPGDAERIAATAIRVATEHIMPETLLNTPQLKAKYGAIRHLYLAIVKELEEQNEFDE